MLVAFQEVSKSFGAFDVLDKVSFQIQPGEKIGLIGANGSGKTTLLSLISGLTEPDSGKVIRVSGLRVGKLEQIPVFHEQNTVLDSALESFAPIRTMEAQLEEMEASIAKNQNPEILDRYSALRQEFEFQEGYSYRATTEAALQGVGFNPDQFIQPAASLSGGEKNRLALARLLLSDANVFLLDEPTNHLDIRSIEWLEHKLRSTKKATLLVSHDRFFLDRTVTSILDLSGGKLNKYSGNYSDYLIQNRQRIERQRKEWQDQREWIARTEDYIRKNIAGQKTRQAQSRRNALARIRRIQKPQETSNEVKFGFQAPERIGRHVMTARELSVGYSGNTILEALNINIQQGERWALAGPNGSGKTTLLKSLVGELAPLRGELFWNERLEIGYYDQAMESVTGSQSVLDELRSTNSTATDGELRSFLAQFLFGGDSVFKMISELSGGERSRLALAKIIYCSPPMLALDEPTNHLDTASRETLEIALEQYPGTMLFVTHDRYLIKKIATHIIYLTEGQTEIFDRFEAFEEWLSVSVPVKSLKKERPNKQTTQLKGPSKNQQNLLTRKIHELEAAIMTAEEQLLKIEHLFQEPPPDIDWDETNQTYISLKGKIEDLYKKLNEQLEEDS